MTIGIDASRAFRAEKTGTEWYSYHIIREMLLQNKSDSLVLYTDTDVSQNHFGFFIPSTAEIRRLQWHIKRFWTQGRLSIEMILHPTDVLFIPSHAIPIAHPKRTVTTIHDVGFLRFGSCYAKKELANLKWSTAYAMNNASRIITVSEFTKREILLFYKAPAEKIHVIYLGYDENMYYPRTEELIQNARHAFNLKKRYCITVGRIDLRKNITFLIEVFEEFKKDGYNGELVLAGPLGFGSEIIVNRIAKSQFVKNIRVLGWIPESDKASLLAGADVFLFPSLYEGFGLPVLEAQACGIPVVCSDVGSLSEICSGTAVLLSLDSPKKWISALKEIIQNTAYKDSLIQKGLLNVKRFSWKKTCDNTLSLIRAM